MTRNVAQDCPQGCVYYETWTCNSLDMLTCTYLKDFKSLGYDNIKYALIVTGLFYMILNGFLFDGLTNPDFIYRYQRGNALSTIALMTTLVYVSFTL